MAMYWAIIGVLADSDMPGSLEIRKTGGKSSCGFAALTHLEWRELKRGMALGKRRHG
jgi:hypothetical protein